MFSILNVLFTNLYIVGVLFTAEETHMENSPEIRQTQNWDHLSLVRKLSPGAVMFQNYNHPPLNPAWISVM